MYQTHKAVEVIRNYSNGSKDIVIEVTCSRCSGSGVFQQYGHINGGKCYKCEGTGTQERQIKTDPNDAIEMVNRTTEVKSIINKTKHENEMVRKSLKSYHEDRKQKLKDAHESYKKDLEEWRQHEEDMKNNPDEYRFTWDD